MRTSDYQRIERAIHFLEANFRSQPRLEDIARHVGLSEFHFQRLFRRWAGISPKRFLQFLTADYARELLRRSRNVLDATGEAGLSSGGRLHDLMVNLHAVTPGELGRGGAGLVIRHGFAATPFGDCLLALTDRGVCHLSFLDHSNRKQALAELKRQWPQATLQPTTREIQTLAQRLFTPVQRGAPLPLLVRGTNLQVKVWEALIRLPPGAVLSYETLAASVGAPRAVRAVASAVARNPIAWLIPCHRVIRKNGAFGEYHWGEARKKAMFAWEAAHAPQTPSTASISPRQRT